jgi:hypothetical protein
MPSHVFRLARGPFLGVRVVLGMLAITMCFIGARANAQSTSCAMESQRVFRSAFSTHRAVLNRVLLVERRGGWRPDGTFRAEFLGRNARILRDIRNLLTRNAIDEASLIRAFSRLLLGRVPDGATLPKRTRADEKARFTDSVRTLLLCRSS